MKKNFKVVVFEGVDGVGKSTQARLLYFALTRKGINVKLFHFPSEALIGNFVRSLLESGQFDLLDEKARALLTAADFYNEFSKDSLKSEVIIFDRYFYSSFVSNNKIEKEWIDMLHRYAPVPDLVFFMNCSIDVINSRAGTDFGAKNLDRQRDFMGRYKNIFKDISKVEIDASEELDVIHNKVLCAVKNEINI